MIHQKRIADRFEQADDRASPAIEIRPRASANRTEKTTSGRYRPLAAAATTLSGTMPLKKSATPGSGPDAFLFDLGERSLKTRGGFARQREQMWRRVMASAPKIAERCKHHDPQHDRARDAPAERSLAALRCR